MACLDIEPIEGDNYLLKSEGCHLKYFVIWAEGETPRWEKAHSEDGNYYQMSYTLDKNKIYFFHVYDGNESEDFRGKFTITT